MSTVHWKTKKWRSDDTIVNVFVMCPDHPLAILVLKSIRLILVVYWIIVFYQFLTLIMVAHLTKDCRFGVLDALFVGENLYYGLYFLIFTRKVCKNKIYFLSPRWA